MTQILIVLLAALAAPAVDEPGGHCAGAWPAAVCHVAHAEIVAAGHDPFGPHPADFANCRVNGGAGCVSRLGAVMLLLRCESRLLPHAYDEGLVGVDSAGVPVWNRSRGIAQIGDGWGHIASDAQAFDWEWSVRWIASDAGRVTKHWYPECGIGG